MITSELKIGAGIFFKDLPSEPTAVLFADVIKIFFIELNLYI